MDIISLFLVELQKVLDRLLELGLFEDLSFQYKLKSPSGDKTSVISEIMSFLTSVQQIHSKSMEQVQCQSNTPKPQKSLPKQSQESKRSSRSCKICHKLFSSSKVLNYHISKVHGEPQQESSEETSFYCCRVCYKCYRNRTDGDVHPCSDQPLAGPIDSAEILKIHNRFSCGYCDEDYRLASRMEYHVSRCDGGPFNCELCSQPFETKKLLVAHKTEKHKNERAFKCPECPLDFQLNTSLQKHLIKNHEAAKETFRCDECPKRFIKKIYLTNHKSRFHNMTKKFLCQVCGERFCTANSLACHVEIHEDIRRFACTECGKAFRRKDKLDFHMSVHTGVKPFKCTECPRAFVRKAKLVEHLRRHRGEKRFCCLVCNKMYSGSYDLRQHLKKIHPNISKHIKPHVPLTPQIIANISVVQDKEPTTKEPAVMPEELLSATAGEVNDFDNAGVNLESLNDTLAIDISDPLPPTTDFTDVPDLVFKIEYEDLNQLNSIS